VLLKEKFSIEPVINGCAETLIQSVPQHIVPSHPLLMTVFKWAVTSEFAPLFRKKIGTVYNFMLR
jgi:hypothetical protein